MSDETKDTTAATPQAPATEAAKETKGKAKAKTEAKGKTEAENGAGALKAVGQAACERHRLAQVWVTSDGQAFPQECDAKEHAKNLSSKETLKVTAK